MHPESGGNVILEGPILGQLIRFGLPLLAGSLFQQLYGSVDAMIVGRYVGGEALAAVGSTTSLVFLFVSFFQGIATGSNIIISQFIGAGERGGVRKATATSLILGLGSGVVLGILFFFLTPAVLGWMLTPADIFDMTRRYLQIYMLSLPAVALYNTGTAILRAMGDSRRPLYFLVLSSAVNIALDLLMVCVLDWGVAGAAWATLISQAVSALLVLLVLFRHAGDYTIALRNLRFHRDLARRTIALGLPAAVQSAAVSFANVLFQSQVNLFGSTAVAGYSAGVRINNFIYMPCSSFGLAATTFVGQNYGAKRYGRIRDCARICMLLSVGITLFFSLLAFFFRYPLVGVFTRDPEVAEYGALMLSVIGLTSFLWAFPHIYGSVITGIGKSFSSMLITMVNMCGVRLLWIFTLLRVWNHILVVYLSFPVSWACASVCMVLYYRRVTKPLYAEDLGAFTQGTPSKDGEVPSTPSPL